LGLALAMAFMFGGCTGPREYLQNGFKVGPNYRPPQAVVPAHWIEANQVTAVQNPAQLARWWTVFNDPTLERLILCAYRQNLTLRAAGYRVLEARAQLAIARGEIFPQHQTANGSYQRVAQSALATPTSPLASVGGRFYDQWNSGFNLAWELDFWGRFRRAISAAEDSLDASVYGYDGALVTLLGDIAANYTTVRTTQERIKLLRANVELQKGVLQFIRRQFEAGFRVNELDLDQATSNLAQTEAQIPQLIITEQQATNQLCILMGMPAVDIRNIVGSGNIPAPPPQVILGVPADLLRRRPDVRQAERLVAAQAEQIGIAEADMYPAISITGNVGWTATRFPDLFTPAAFNGMVGPSFQWNILNYGRIVNNVRFQDARFKELVATYQNLVLQASVDVENGMATFLDSQQQAKYMTESVTAAQKATRIVIIQYEKGTVDFNRYAVIQQALVQQQDLLAQAQGGIAQGLVQIYRAMGGGWEIRLSGMGPTPLCPIAGPLPAQAATGLEAPAPVTPAAKTNPADQMPPAPTMPDAIPPAPPAATAPDHAPPAPGTKAKILDPSTAVPSEEPSAAPPTPRNDRTMLPKLPEAPQEPAAAPQPAISQTFPPFLLMSQYKP
jgi:NodT family efflux transporter outer membrane factor (OMF) lipoprotein